MDVFEEVIKDNHDLIVILEDISKDLKFLNEELEASLEVW